MLTKIVDMENVRLENEEQERALNIDLKRRLPKLDHSRKPEGTEAFKITVRNGIYFDSFIFEIQYGKGNKEDFRPIGESYTVNSACLPTFLNV